MVFAFVRVIFLGRTGENLIAFLAVGLVAFQFLAQCLTGSAKSISSKAGIITQVYLPKVVFPFSVVLTQLINFAFGLVTIAVILALSGIVPGPELAWLPLIILVHTVFNVVLGLIVAYVAVFVRDLERILGHVTRILRFTSPVLWEADRIPEDMRWLLDWNPFAWLLDTYRDVLMYGRTPNLVPILYLGMVCVVLVGLLLIFYTYNEHRMIKAL